LIVGRRDDYVNPTTDGSLSSRSIHSFNIDYEEAMYNWKDGNRDISSWNCTSSKVIRWIRIDLQDPPFMMGLEMLEGIDFTHIVEGHPTH
jgi:hypothetical protein